MKLGMVTIGQSPRNDVLEDMRAVWGPEYEAVETGALDGLSPQEIALMRPQPGEHLLVTRLRDGSEVKVAEKHIAGRVAGCIADLERENVELVILLCTGEFPELRSTRLILRPDRIVMHTVRSVLPGGKLGILVPAEEQIPVLMRRWQGAGYDVALESVSPYSSSPAQVRGKARQFAGIGVDMVVLDCIGFNTRVKAAVAEVTGKPVILPRTLVARVARELTGC